MQTRLTMREAPARPSVAGIGSAIALSILLGACGSGSSSGASDSTTSTEAPAVTCPATDGSSPRTIVFATPPPMCIDPAKQYTAVVDTDRGSFTISLDSGRAPAAVNNFVFLSRYQFYDGLDFYRVIPDTMVAAGKLPPPERDDPGYRFADELPADNTAYAPGAVLMDNDGPDSNGSGFFVLITDQPIAPKFTAFGTVTQGFDTTIPAIDATGTPGGTPTAPTVIRSVTIAES